MDKVPINPTRLRALVREIVVSTLERAVDTPPTPSATKRESLLLLFMGRNAVEDDFFLQAEYLAGRDHSLAAVFSHSFRNSGNTDSVLARLPRGTAHFDAASESELLSLTRNSRALVAPDLSLNTAAKVVLGIADSIPSFLIQQFLVSGKLAVICRDPAAAGTTLFGNHATVPPALSRAAEDHLHMIRQLGLRFTPVGGLCDTLASAFHIPVNETPERLARTRTPMKREFITVEDVWKALSQGRKEIVISAGAVVTDEAREYAARSGVAFQNASH
jgi:hypothetical protein